MKFLTGVLGLYWLLPFSVQAEESVNPGINDYYYGSKHSEWVPVFETPSREVYQQRQAILKILNIKPGMRIADIGAGTGFYSLMFADSVGNSGKVYAVDIVQDFIDTVEVKAQQAGFKNLTGIINNGRESGLEINSIDMAFICDTYHHFEYPETTMRSIHQALIKNGEVVIIDFRKDPKVSNRWVQGHVRSGREEVIAEMKAFGFTLVDDSPLLHSNFLLRFKKS